MFSRGENFAVAMVIDVSSLRLCAFAFHFLSPRRQGAKTAEWVCRTNAAGDTMSPLPA